MLGALPLEEERLIYDVTDELRWYASSQTLVSGVLTLMIIVLVELRLAHAASHVVQESRTLFCRMFSALTPLMTLWHLTTQKHILIAHLMIVKSRL